MTNRTFILSVLTSALLLACFFLSKIIGHQQLAFAFLGSLLLGASLIIFVKQRVKTQNFLTVKLSIQGK